MNLEMQRQDVVKQLIDGWRDHSPVVHAMYESMIVCKRCKARNECSAPVTGVGSLRARIMILGRNPGKQEDKHGVPFIGPGGSLLDQWLVKAGIDRNKIYITNMVKCYTTKDRPPESDEISACADWFQKELTMVSPDLILAFGKQAGGFILGQTGNELRLRIHARTFLNQTYQIIPCIHPGAPLRNSNVMKNFNDDAYFVKGQIANNPLLVDCR